MRKKKQIEIRVLRKTREAKIMMYDVFYKRLAGTCVLVSFL